MSNLFHEFIRLTEKQSATDRRVDRVEADAKSTRADVKAIRDRITTYEAWAIRVLIIIAVSGSWIGTVVSISPKELGEKIAAIISELR